MENAQSYEEEHVHSVYEEIASHFSSTRYKVGRGTSAGTLPTYAYNFQPWPLIESFMNSLRPGSIGVDIGCGNGKYLPINKDVFIIASDRSSNLVDIAKRHQPHSVLVADILDVPHPAAKFDFAISIAVIHHLSSRDRRIAAVKSILDLLRNRSDGSGKALLYVWALEQKSSRRGWDEGGQQDVMVPWVLKSKGQTEDKTFQRYYHLYRKGELEEDIGAAGGLVIESGYEKDNWWAIAGKRDGNED
jgi:tRNA (uracil-5-)-methyltransferase TRM9